MIKYDNFLGPASIGTIWDCKRQQQSGVYNLKRAHKYALLTLATAFFLAFALGKLQSVVEKQRPILKETIIRHPYGGEF